MKDTLLSANDLYALEPQCFGDISMLKGCYYDHVPEVADLRDLPEAPEVQIKIIKEFDFDIRRFWRLASVWFNGTPVMIIQNAGREGDDHFARFVTNKDAYRSMVSYLQSLAGAADKIEDRLDPLFQSRALTEFYDHSLYGTFEPF